MKHKLFINGMEMFMLFFIDLIYINIISNLSDDLFLVDN